MSSVGDHNCGSRIRGEDMTKLVLVSPSKSYSELDLILVYQSYECWTLFIFILFYFSLILFGIRV